MPRQSRQRGRNDYYQTDYSALIELAQQQIADMRFLDAKAILHAAIADQPREPEAYHLIGVIYEIQGDWIKA